MSHKIRCLEEAILLIREKRSIFMSDKIGEMNISTAVNYSKIVNNLDWIEAWYKSTEGRLYYAGELIKYVLIKDEV